MEEDEAGVKFESLGTLSQEAHGCSSCQYPPSLSRGCGPPSCSSGLCSGAFPAATVILFLPQRPARPLLSSGQPPWYVESPGSSGHRLQGRRSRWLWLEARGPELQSLSGGKGFLAVSGRRPCRLSREPPACLTTLSLNRTTPVVRPFSLIHSRAKSTCLVVLHRNSHGSLFSMEAFKYLETALLSPSLPPIFLLQAKYPLFLKPKPFPYNPAGAKPLVMAQELPLTNCFPSNNRVGLDQEFSRTVPAPAPHTADSSE